MFAHFTPTRPLFALTLAIAAFAVTGCGEVGVKDPLDSSTGGSSAGGSSAGGSSASSGGAGGTGGSFIGSGGAVQVEATGGSATGGDIGSGEVEGGAGSTCDPGTIGQCVDSDPEQLSEECFSPEELNDPCHYVHLASVATNNPPEIAVDYYGPPVGDGGTSLCPSVEKLTWNWSGRCGCLLMPSCSSKTVEREGKCCYRVRWSDCLFC